MNYFESCIIFLYSVFPAFDLAFGTQMIDVCLFYFDFLEVVLNKSGEACSSGIFFKLNISGGSSLSIWRP